MCGRTNQHRREENAIYLTRRSYNRSAHKRHWEEDVHNRLLLFPSMDTGTTMSWESAESSAHRTRALRLQGTCLYLEVACTWTSQERCLRSDGLDIKHISAKFESDSAFADEECPYLREGTAACEKMMGALNTQSCLGTSVKCCLRDKGRKRDNYESMPTVTPEPYLVPKRGACYSSLDRG